MPIVERDGRRIHFVQEGNGPGLVLVPGLGSGARLFGTLPRRFGRAGFTCVAVDPCGLEPSGPLPGSDYDFDEAAEDVLAVARTLPGPVGLVGTSLGGKVSLRAAARAPDLVESLVMLCSAANASARSRRVYRMFEILATKVEGSAFGEVVAPFLFGATFLEARAAVVDDIIRATRPTPQSRAFMAAQARALQEFDGSDDAQRCRSRTLCLAGAEDTLTPPEEVAATARQIPSAVFEVVEKAGHSLLLESATAFDRVVEALRQ